MGQGRPGWKLVAAVVALSAYSCAEAIVHWGEFPHPGKSTAIAALWAAVLPLPLLLARSRPTLAGTAIVLLILARAALEYRGPGSVAQSPILLIALFVVEAGRTRPGPPLRGAALGAFMLAAVVVMDQMDVGNYAMMDPILYAHLLLLLVSGIGAGVALRDRRDEAARLEAELAATDAGRVARIETLMAVERSRIAGEIDRAVALLLDRVRPLAERAARSLDPAALRADMSVVKEVAAAAMAEMRRALGLLRAPLPAGGEIDLASAVAASRRTRLRQAAGWAAPVVLLAALGLFEQHRVSSGPLFIPGSDGDVFVPGPVLGQVSPWVTAVVCVLPLLGRARWPLGSTAAVCALLLLRFGLHDLSTLTFTQFYLAAAAAFFGAAHARSLGEGIAAGLVGVGTSLLCMELEQMSYHFLGFGFAAVLPAVAATGGLAVRERVATAARARRAREELDGRHEELAREELVGERLRAARELHDVVGHVVTVIGLQAAVASRYAERDIEQAREAARTVAAVTGEAERDLGRLTAFLEVDSGPLPEAGSVAELVARLRAAGLPVSFEQRLGGEELPLPISQVAFRLVQEALTNVSRHAGAVPTTVTIERRGAVLAVEVVNELRGAGGRAATPGSEPAGSGLAGMRERAAIYGGSLEAGPDGAGRWRVRAELPLLAAPAASPV